MILIKEIKDIIDSDIQELIEQTISIRKSNEKNVRKELGINLKDFYIVSPKSDFHKILFTDLKYLYHIGRVIRNYSIKNNGIVAIKDAYIEIEKYSKRLDYFQIRLVLVPNLESYGNIIYPVFILRDHKNQLRYFFSITFNDVFESVKSFLLFN